MEKEVKKRVAEILKQIGNENIIPNGVILLTDGCMKKVDVKDLPVFKKLKEKYL